MAEDFSSKINKFVGPVPMVPAEEEISADSFKEFSDLLIKLDPATRAKELEKAQQSKDPRVRDFADVFMNRAAPVQTNRVPKALQASSSVSDRVGSTADIMPGPGGFDMINPVQEAAAIAPVTFSVDESKMLPPSAPRPAPPPEAEEEEVIQPPQEIVQEEDASVQLSKKEEDLGKKLAPPSPAAANTAKNALIQINANLRDDPTLGADIKEVFTSRLTQLQENLTSINAQFESKWDAAQKEFKTREDKLAWGQIAETVGQALTQFGAAYYGLQKMKSSGVPIDMSNLKMQATNWDAKMDRAMEQLKAQREQISAAQKESVSGIQTEMGELGKFQREALQQAGQDARALRSDQIKVATSQADLAMRQRELDSKEAMTLARIDNTAKSGKLNKVEENRAKAEIAKQRRVQEVLADPKMNMKAKVDFLINSMQAAGASQAEIEAATDVINEPWFSKDPVAAFPYYVSVSNRYLDGIVSGGGSQEDTVDVDDL